MKATISIARVVFKLVPLRSKLEKKTKRDSSTVFTYIQNTQDTNTLTQNTEKNIVKVDVLMIITNFMYYYCLMNSFWHRIVIRGFGIGLVTISLLNIRII